MLWNLSRRIKPKEKYVRISLKEIWLNLDGPPKNKELWSYVVNLNLVGRKVAQRSMLFVKRSYTLCVVTASNADKLNGTPFGAV